MGTDANKRQITLYAEMNEPGEVCIVFSAEEPTLEKLSTAPMAKTETNRKGEHVVEQDLDINGLDEAQKLWVCPLANTMFGRPVKVLYGKDKEEHEAAKKENLWAADWKKEATVVLPRIEEPKEEVAPVAKKKKEESSSSSDSSSESSSSSSKSSKSKKSKKSHKMSKEDRKRVEEARKKEEAATKKDKEESSSEIHNKKRHKKNKDDSSSNERKKNKKKKYLFKKKKKKKKKKK